MTTTHPGTFEGAPFQAPNGFIYDSRAAWYITRWSHVIAMGKMDPWRMGVLHEELMAFPHFMVSLANPQYLNTATAVSLEDGSSVIIARPANNPDLTAVYRLTGEAGPGSVCCLDWGYDPPVASTAVPLEGNMNPPVSSLEIG